MTKKQLLAVLKKTNDMLDHNHRGSMYPSKDCPVCQHVKATRQLIRDNS